MIEILTHISLNTNQQAFYNYSKKETIFYFNKTQNNKNLNFLERFS